MGYISLESWFRASRVLVGGGISLSEYEGMSPWEREVHLDLIVQEIEERMKELEKARKR